MLVVRNSLVSEFEKFSGKSIDASKNHLEDYWVNGHHQRHWVSNETGEKVADAIYMPSHEEFLERKKLREKLAITLEPLINTN